MTVIRTVSQGLRHSALPSEVQHPLLAQGGSVPASVAFLSSFPPRECGIATFTADLADAVDRAQPEASPAQVIAIQPGGQSYRYGPRVRWTIERDQHSSYEQAAAAINRAPVQVVSIQHEYGLFGGEQGADLLAFVHTVQKPVVLTLHTVLEHPPLALQQVTEALAEEVSAVVVLAERAKQILAEYYPGVPPEKLWFIPHGTPITTLQSTDRMKRALGWEHRTVLSTFGLLSPGKGIEEALSALPRVVECHPDVLYLVLGETHPEVRRQQGESYREQLERRVEALGLQHHVRFENRYLTQAEVLAYLHATDVYVIPYRNPLQISSGTLAYALAAGKAIVSTPFVYAQELLSEGRGLLARFQDSASLAAAINLLLEQPRLRRQVELAAYTYGTRMHWPQVGQAYRQIFHHAIQQTSSLCGDIHALNISTEQKDRLPRGSDILASSGRR